MHENNDIHRLPPSMRKEHRTRSELVREALRFYLSTRIMPMETPTADQIRAYRSGIAAYKRGDYVTLGEYLDGMDRRSRRARKRST
jgi:hypothetical protein